MVDIQTPHWIPVAVEHAKGRPGTEVHRSAFLLRKGDVLFKGPGCRPGLCVYLRGRVAQHVTIVETVAVQLRVLLTYRYT